MLKVIGKKIFITRGDTAYITVNVYAPDGSEYVLQEGDKLWFAVKRKTTDKDYLISPKELSIGINPSTGKQEAVLSIFPQETKNLDFGSFVYDVSLVNTAKNFVNTIIEPSSFTITEEVCSVPPGGGR